MVWSCLWELSYRCAADSPRLVITNMATRVLLSCACTMTSCLGLEILLGNGCSNNMHFLIFAIYTRWFKYDRDYLCVNCKQSVPVIFEPPCVCVCVCVYIYIYIYMGKGWKIILYVHLCVCVCSHESNSRQRLLSFLPSVLRTFVRAKCSAGIAQLQ